MENRVNLPSRFVHLYHGDGKGKTTCAIGLVHRFAHYGSNVLVIQFLKDGTSGEIVQLQSLENVTVKAYSPTGKFSWNMSPEEKEETKQVHHELLRFAQENPWDLLVLDELCAALTTKMMDLSLVEEFLTQAKGEVVITGRNPPPFLLEIADYVTCMTLEKHPFSQGIPPRQGIEF